MVEQDYPMSGSRAFQPRGPSSAGTGQGNIYAASFCASAMRANSAYHMRFTAENAAAERGTFLWRRSNIVADTLHDFVAVLGILTRQCNNLISRPHRRPDLDIRRTSSAMRRPARPT